MTRRQAIKITAHNSDTQHREQAAGWRAVSLPRTLSGFRFAGSIFWPGVCEFVGGMDIQKGDGDEQQTGGT
jgi:hypothetical protein